MDTRSAYVVISDPRQRAGIVAALVDDGWSVVELPTGFHVLAAIADILDGSARDRPAKIVIDELARGCTGQSIAAGLRQLGVDIPIELVRPPPRPSRQGRGQTSAFV